MSDFAGMSGDVNYKRDSNGVGGYKEMEQITSLGSNTKRNFAEVKNPMPEWLQTFDNKHSENIYLVSFIQPEATFRSLCPKTGQPDSARMEIIYVPNIKMVESKSLKEYLQSFQNSGEFHEDVCNRIANDLFKLLEPKYLRVYGDFIVRGDLAIKPLVVIWGNGSDNKYDEERIGQLVASWDLKK